VLEKERPVEEQASAAIREDRIEELYVRYAPGAIRFAYLLIGDADQAEDCVQDAFVRVVGRLGHIRNAEAFDAYLRSTIVNLTKNHWRRRALERTHAERERPPTAVTSAEGSVADRIRVWHAVLRLPIRQRIAVVLRFYEDLSEAEIASIMHCQPGTARSLVSRGTASLRGSLERFDDG
jgi:RNA polymerase sigma-70 factor (sigma-E family)